MKRARLFKKWDFLLVLALLLISGIWLLCRGGGDAVLTATVYQDGSVIHSIDLSAVKDPYAIRLSGTPAAILQVEPGRIRYLEADCDDRLCVSAGWLHHAGATAACLPGRTMVILTSAKEDMAMTY